MSSGAQTLTPLSLDWSTGMRCAEKRAQVKGGYKFFLRRAAPVTVVTTLLPLTQVDRRELVATCLQVPHVFRLGLVDPRLSHEDHNTGLTLSGDLVHGLQEQEPLEPQGARLAVDVNKVGSGNS
jgi:hypothetical protein